MAEKKDETIVDVVEVYSKTEKYIEENQKSLSVIIGAIVLIVGGFFAYKKLYVEPLEIEAQSQMFMAENYLAIDSINLAIKGDGNYLGFLDIIDEYGVTPSGNLAHYYAGICYYKQGQYQEAIEFLNSFDADDNIVGAVAIGVVGDAYMQLGEVKNATSYYMDAANHSRNDFSCPIYLMKAAGAYEDQGNYKKAVGIYTDIKKNFADTKEGLEVDKYLYRAKAMASN